MTKPEAIAAKAASDIPDSSTVEKAIMQTEAIALLLQDLGCVGEYEMIAPKAVHWLGSQLAEAATLLRANETTKASGRVRGGGMNTISYCQELDEAISAAEHIAMTLEAVGLSQDPLKPAMILWLGEQLAAACERMREVTDNDGRVAA